MKLTGKRLTMGESDASSFPSEDCARPTMPEAIRQDITSPAFVKAIGGYHSLYPTIFVSYTGEALDNKTPLLAFDAGRQPAGARELCACLEIQTQKSCPQSAQAGIFFSRPREVPGAAGSPSTQATPCLARPLPRPRSWRTNTMALSASGWANSCAISMWSFGKWASRPPREDNEVAPAQHEMAPIYCDANLAVDQNQLTMETMEAGSDSTQSGVPAP